ncbi:hypothetical protein ACFW9D_25205 [Streptomyces sp. NPDC059524]|uniref:hypothetical protein n=1 Tax=Streptomyces sp. NPDC059524 TaxID=3346856 RepID=UPI0036A548D2
MTRPPTGLHQLHQALDRLAWPAERQIEHLRRWGVGPDELALEFDDAYRMVPALDSQGILPDDVGARLRQVDSLLEEMSEGADPEWTHEAVTRSPTWDRLRHSAQAALEALHRNR